MINDIKKYLKKFTGSNESQITINGKTFRCNNVSVVNGKVTVDGKEMEMPDAKNIHISIEGDVGTLNIDCGDVQVSGDVGYLNSQQGDVKVGGDVNGTATLNMGDLECIDVSVDMGNVKASTIHGSVKTKMGNITR